MLPDGPLWTSPCRIVGEKRCRIPRSLANDRPRSRLTPELSAECERVINKTLPACVAFHKPSFLQQLKNASMDPTMVNALLTTAAR